MKKLLVLFCLAIQWPAFSQGEDTIKVMYYNILNFPDINSSRITYLETVVQHVLPDILVVSELTSLAGSNTILNSALNVGGINYYAAATYVDSPDDERMLYYNTQKLGFVRQHAIPTALRDINEYVLYYKAPGLTAASDTAYLYLYACHLKAGNTSTDASDRAAETAILKSYLNTRVNPENTIVGGDMNIYNSSEVAYINMTGTTQANLYDPIGAGYYHGNPTYTMHFTQSTRIDPIDGGSTGGMDDRFDHMWFSDDVQFGDNAVKFIPGSYRAVGQDGLRLNQSLLSPTNNSEPSTVVNALYYMSDHLPVYMELEIGGNLGLAEGTSLPDVRIYPVPADEQVQVVLSSGMATGYAIYDMAGRLMDRASAHGSTIQIQTNGFGEGTYMIRIETEQGSVNRKLIIR